MKRRLSVAIALSGNPKVRKSNRPLPSVFYHPDTSHSCQIVYLDEPTTGLDPISRRHLWGLVDSVKKNRAIILTTHSMEEADILGDRIGIMVRGSLQCVGTSLRLKSRFGSGYRVSVRVQSDSAHAKTIDSCKNGIKSLFMSRLGVKSVDETHEYVHFQVPYENEDKLPLMLAYVKVSCHACLLLLSLQLTLSIDAESCCRFESGRRAAPTDPSGGGLLKRHKESRAQVCRG